MPIMKNWNGYEIYDEVARGHVTAVTTTGNGSAYTATVEGIDRLATGISFIMIPHVVSTSTSPTLNVNRLGAKNIRQRLSSGTSNPVVGDSTGWLSANKPIRMVYDGTYWIVDFTKPDLGYSNGIVPVSSGGTGANTVAKARDNLGLGNTSGALPIANGGTGATNTLTALNNLGITWGTEEAPATGTPNTIYIQIN